MTTQTHKLDLKNVHTRLYTAHRDPVLVDSPSCHS